LAVLLTKLEIDMVMGGADTADNTSSDILWSLTTCIGTASSISRILKTYHDDKFAVPLVHAVTFAACGIKEIIDDFSWGLSFAYTVGTSLAIIGLMFAWRDRRTRAIAVARSE
jgi:hypothetical protein